MSVLLNIVWLLCGGLIAGLIYLLGGALLCITVVGIPFGLQAIRLGVAVLTPFGKHVVRDRLHQGFLALVFDVIWLLVFGWSVAVAHLVGGRLLGQRLSPVYRG